MHKEEIEIAILPDGRIEYTIKGVKGRACEQISAVLEQLGQLEADARTGEFYEDGQSVTLSIDNG